MTSMSWIRSTAISSLTPTRPGHTEMQGEARFILIGDRLYAADTVVENAADLPQYFFCTHEGALANREPGLSRGVSRFVSRTHEEPQ